MKAILDFNEKHERPLKFHKSCPPQHETGRVLFGCVLTGCGKVELSLARCENQKHFLKALKIQLASLQQHCNPQYVNGTACLFTGPRDETLMNFTLTSFVETEKLFIIMTVNFPSDSKDTEYGHQVMKSTVELCKVLKRTTGNFIIKVMMDSLKNSKNFPFQCPLKPHTVQLANMDFSSMLLPTTLLLGETKFVSELRIKAKLPGLKQLVYLHTLKFYFESV